MLACGHQEKDANRMNKFIKNAQFVVTLKLGSLEEVATNRIHSNYRKSSAIN